MITIKEWNSMSHHQRRTAAYRLYFNMSKEFVEDIANEFHHNFDYNDPKGHQDGHWYKLLLHCISKTKNGYKMTLSL